MINRLRRSFITAAMLSLLLVFLVIVGAINLLNYHDMTAAADEVLVMLAENGGVFPAWKSQKLQALLENPQRPFLPAVISPSEWRMKPPSFPPIRRRSPP